MIYLGEPQQRSSETDAAVPTIICPCKLKLSAVSQQSTGYFDMKNHVYLAVVSRFSTSSDILNNLGEINLAYLHV